MKFRFGNRAFNVIVGLLIFCVFSAQQTVKAKHQSKVLCSAALQLSPKTQFPAKHVSFLDEVTFSPPPFPSSSLKIKSVSGKEVTIIHPYELIAESVLFLFQSFTYTYSKTYIEPSDLTTLELEQLLSSTYEDYFPHLEQYFPNQKFSDPMVLSIAQNLFKNLKSRFDFTSPEIPLTTFSSLNIDGLRLEVYILIGIEMGFIQRYFEASGLMKINFIPLYKDNRYQKNPNLESEEFDYKWLHNKISLLSKIQKH